MGEKKNRQAHEERIKAMCECEEQVAPAIWGLDEALKNHKEPGAIQGLRAKGEIWRITAL